MLISVIVPVYNRPAAAMRAVASVLNQTVAGSAVHEIIVVDDGSQPPLALEHPDPRVKLIRQLNAGPSAARNAGVRAASGRLIAFLDSDDVWLPTKVSGQLSMVQNGCYDALTATVCGFYYPNRQTGRLEARTPRPANSLMDWVSGCWFSPGSTLLIPRAAFDIVGLMDESLRRLEDLDWFIRFGQKGGRLQVAPCMGALIAPSYSGRSETIMASAGLIEKKFAATGPHSLGRAEWRRLQAYLAIERGAAMLHEGKRLRGLGHILQSLWLKPRLQPSVGKLWDRSDTVPDDVAKTFAAMLQQPR